MTIQSELQPFGNEVIFNCLWVLTGPIRYFLKSMLPKHIAFIPDGNRRFARMNGIKTAEGHIKGRFRVESMMQICYLLGIREVSFYLFSLHNLKRSQEELNGLSENFNSFFNQLTKQLPLLIQHGIKIKCIGDQSKADSNTISLIKKVVDPTSDNDAFTVNFFMNYAARDEICRGIKEILKEGGKSAGSKEVPIIQRILKAARKSEVNDVDLLVRTSGETRLSDFLLYESRNAQLYFVDKLWPEFSMFELFKSLYAYILS